MQSSNVALSLVSLQNEILKIAKNKSCNVEVSKIASEIKPKKEKGPHESVHV